VRDENLSQVNVSFASASQRSGWTVCTRRAESRVALPRFIMTELKLRPPKPGRASAMGFWAENREEKMHREVPPLHVREVIVLLTQKRRAGARDGKY
jgi:hypothetical protein